MTIGQMAELGVLALIPFFAKTTSRKTFLAIGLLAYAARMLEARAGTEAFIEAAREETEAMLADLARERPVVALGCYAKVIRPQGDGAPFANDKLPGVAFGQQVVAELGVDDDDDAVVMCHRSAGLGRGQDLHLVHCQRDAAQGDAAVVVILDFVGPSRRHDGRDG